MHNFICMKIGKGITNTIKNSVDGAMISNKISLYEVKEIPIFCIFKHQIRGQSFLVEKEVQKFDNIGMVQIFMNFNFIVCDLSAYFFQGNQLPAF